MFKELEEMLGNMDKINLSIRKSGGKLNVVVQPIMANLVSENEDAETQGLKLALSMPLSITATADELSEEFIEVLKQYTVGQGEMNKGVQASIKRVEKAHKESKTKPIAPKKVDKKVEEKVEVVAESVLSPANNTNHDSIF